MVLKRKILKSYVFLKSMLGMFNSREYVFKAKITMLQSTLERLPVVGFVWGASVDTAAVDSAVEAVIVDETDCTGTAVVWEVVDLTVVSAVVPTVADAAVVLVVWAAVVDSNIVSVVWVEVVDAEFFSVVWAAVVGAAVGCCVAPRSTVNIYNVIKDFKIC